MDLILAFILAIVVVYIPVHIFLMVTAARQVWPDNVETAREQAQKKAHMEAWERCRVDPASID